MGKEGVSVLLYLYPRETRRRPRRNGWKSSIKSNDGFYIAGEDLKLRGPGDLFGIRQSGIMEFRIGDIFNDADILKDASRAAGEILALDPDLDLPQHGELRKMLQIF